MAKFKSSKRAKKVEIDSIVFMSTMESNYYLKLKDDLAHNRIKKFECQPVYLLQEAYKKYGKAIRKIEYIGDFLVTNLDNSEVTIDVKGRAGDTPDFRLKRKMFDFKYPDKILLLVTWDDVSQSWMDYDKYKKLLKQRKAAAKKVREEAATAKEAVKSKRSKKAKSK
jgi:hypothetical protein